MFSDRGELLQMDTTKTGNPRRRKDQADIKKQGSSKILKKRCHQYCQPTFCCFYGGTAWNCDGTRRLDVEIPDKTVWAEADYLGPEWRDVIKGTRLEFKDGE